MKCPKCGQELRVSTKDPNFGLCDNCKKKYKISAAVAAPAAEAAPVAKAAASPTSPANRKKPVETPKSAPANRKKSAASSSPAAKRQASAGISKTPVKKQTKSARPHSQTGYYTDEQYDDEPHHVKKKYANVPPSKVRSTRESEMRQGYDELLAIDDDKPGIGSNILTAVIIILVLAILGVGGYFVYNNIIKDKISTKTESTKDTSTDKDAAASKDLAEGDYADTGNGSFSVSTDAGSSADGSSPVLTLSSADTTTAQIGYAASGLSGDNLTYIYIDGYLNTKASISDTQGTLDLASTALTEGAHKVEVVQYENEIPTGTMVTYKTCSYTVQIQAA